MRPWLISTICWLMLGVAAGLPAQTVDVNIQPYNRLTAFEFQALGDEVAITSADSFPILYLELNTLDRVEVQNDDEGVKLLKDGKLFGRYPELLFWVNDPAPRFKITPTRGKGTPRDYPGHLWVKPGARGLTLINRVHLEDYVKGVIHAEAGHHRTLDFYKVQALSARTYALRSLGRHGKVGYDLCDNTHCQVFRGIIPKNDLLEQAVAETIGEVIVQGEGHLVEAVFSANCGGYTANSEDVWVSEVSYLRAVNDYNFCEGFSNHAWHLTIPKIDFLARLGQYFKVEARQFEVIPDESGRVKSIFVNQNRGLTIAGEEIRSLFRLKSSRFHIYDANTLLFIEGHGFGHGVGMCQDGAYYLSRMGMDYERIIKHYYKDVEIQPLGEVSHIW